ncbi:PREDICTED: uncharacterized protein LOC106915845 isoform X2 [Poecilia mexicana]|uniref:uncharacterized protein LOC106915845 isoform X2 n=1 Tax=Poecilia mexicana TaxID=48701 RepID=UPI00072EB2F7|nr:PREDICTED: uncharacterized protein LOC106915845 isoform X2 [Poecilia mexicana]
MFQQNPLSRSSSDVHSVVGRPLLPPLPPVVTCLPLHRSLLSVIRVSHSADSTATWSINLCLTPPPITPGSPSLLHGRLQPLQDQRCSSKRQMKGGPLRSKRQHMAAELPGCSGGEGAADGGRPAKAAPTGTGRLRPQLFHMCIFIHTWLPRRLHSDCWGFPDAPLQRSNFSVLMHRNGWPFELKQCLMGRQSGTRERA